MQKGAGYYYRIRMRLRGQLYRHHWTVGRSFTRNQEDAWDLLNEMEQVISTLGKVQRFLPADDRFELTADVRRILLLHSPTDPFAKKSSEPPSEADVHAGSKVNRSPA